MTFKQANSTVYMSTKQWIEFKTVMINYNVISKITFMSLLYYREVSIAQGCISMTCWFKISLPTKLTINHIKIHLLKQ